MRRLTNLAESRHDPHPETLDDGSSISFLAREPAGEVEGYPVVGIINTKTVDVSRCTIEGEGKDTCVGFFFFLVFTQNLYIFNRRTIRSAL